MGIRMQMVVGYGLDLSCIPILDKSKLNYKNLKDPKLFIQFRKEVMDFSKEFNDISERAIFHESMLNPVKSLVDLVNYEDEFADPNRLVLVPGLQKTSWVRGGNYLDSFLYEAQQGEMEFRMDAEWIPHPGVLSPYIGLMKANPKCPLGVEKFWKSCYKNYPEYKDELAWAPWHLWFLIKVLFDLTPEQTTEVYLNLRPGVYRYWC